MLKVVRRNGFCGAVTAGMVNSEVLREPCFIAAFVVQALFLIPPDLLSAFLYPASQLLYFKPLCFGCFGRLACNSFRRFYQGLIDELVHFFYYQLFIAQLGPCFL